VTHREFRDHRTRRGCEPTDVGLKDIYGDSTGLRVLANDISRTSAGIQVDSGLTEDNYIRDLASPAATMSSPAIFRTVNLLGFMLPGSVETS
jgi:hypothetical protein